MADASNIKVAVEGAVHLALAETILEIWRQHGIIVSSVSVSWLDISSPSKHDYILEKINIESITRPQLMARGAGK